MTISQSEEIIAVGKIMHEASKKKEAAILASLNELIVRGVLAWEQGGLC